MTPVRFCVHLEKVRFLSALKNSFRKRRRLPKRSASLTSAHWSLCLAASLILLTPKDAWAYLDPGTGSMLLSVVVGLVSSAYFFIRKLPSIARNLIYRFSGKKDALKSNRIVIYSESKNYWLTWKPILCELVKAKIPLTYLTSDSDDPVFKENLGDLVLARFIGKGNTAYTALGFLEADIFLLTTPGLDVLQIRRSSGVKKYVHVVHAVGDIHTYKLFSFDYYDAVFCSGPSQIKSLRTLESIRKTKSKTLKLVGCPYLDCLSERAKREAVSPDKKTVLVAPTWGKNGMLTRLGSLIPQLLAKAGFTVILRPHPQSFISDVGVIKKVEVELSTYPNVVWDRNPDGFPSLSKAAILVSDVSGVVFDFAFVFLRPVITVGDGPLKEGFEAWDIPHEAWEMSAYETLGRHLKTGEESSIAEVTKELFDKGATRTEEIRALREKEAMNFGVAAKAVVKELLVIEEELKGGNHA